MIVRLGVGDGRVSLDEYTLMWKEPRRVTSITWLLIRSSGPLAPHVGLCWIGLNCVRAMFDESGMQPVTPAIMVIII